jgi:hypothetical protein
MLQYFIERKNVLKDTKNNNNLVLQISRWKFDRLLKKQTLPSFLCSRKESREKTNLAQGKTCPTPLNKKLDGLSLNVYHFIRNCIIYQYVCSQYKKEPHYDLRFSIGFRNSVVFSIGFRNSVVFSIGFRNSVVFSIGFRNSVVFSIGFRNSVVFSVFHFITRNFFFKYWGNNTITERDIIITERSVWPSWSWSYGGWIYNYLCNQYLSPLTLWVRTILRRGVRETTIYDQVCQWLATDRWFFPDTPVSSNNPNLRRKECSSVNSSKFVYINFRDLRKIVNS